MDVSFGCLFMTFGWAQGCLLEAQSASLLNRVTTPPTMGRKDACGCLVIPRRGIREKKNNEHAGRTNERSWDGRTLKRTLVARRSDSPDALASEPRAL